MAGPPPEAEPAAHMADVGSAAPGWLRQARQLAEDHGQDHIREALDLLAAGRGRPAFRIAVVGEFNRGKSTLINRLLGRDLLPTGPLPVSRTPVVIRVSDEEGLTLGWPDGRRELRKLDDDTLWDGLTGPPVEREPGAPEGSPEPAVTVAVAHDWLAGLDAEVVDTPGVNSGTEEQFEQVRRTAAGSDAVLLVVSALSPMSITERRLLEEEVLCRHVPFVAVVVTMLDLVDGDDREESVRDLGARLSGLAGLPVLTAPVPGGGESELASLRSLLEGFARDSERVLWRDRAIAAQVADHCEAMARIADEADAAGRLPKEEVAERARLAQVLRESEDRQWEQLRVDLMGRQLRLGTRLREHVQKGRDGIIERLRWDLERASDPGTWWERDLPVRLGHELSLLARSSERTLLLPAMAADTDWLDGEVTRRLPGASRSPLPGALELSTEPDISGEVSSLSRTRLVTRLGAQGGSILGFLIAAARQGRRSDSDRSGPPPMVYSSVLSLVGGLLAEAYVRNATEEQRRQVDAVLVRAVDESAGVFQRRAVDELGDVYADVFARLRESHRAWADARRAAVESASASASASGTDWPRLANAATELAARIRSALACGVPAEEEQE
ncbi:dynamin family protein [Streptomyces sp. NPDC001549]|uniref:dynamin family protein n=1 Tax=Streptomyces sp. NPDC001549 TaxID=3364586 RepID=UPI00367949DA